MNSNQDMSVDRSDDALIVRSPHRGINWLGAVFATFALFWTLSWNRHDAQGEDAYWRGLGIGISFILVGIALLLPRSIVTIFDLRTRRVGRRMSVFGLTYRNQSYPFSEIKGVGIIEGSQDDNRDSLPVIILKSGAVLTLNTTRTYRVDVGDKEAIDHVVAVCAATALANAGARPKVSL